MATKEETNQLSQYVNALNQYIQDCPEIAKALLEIGEPLRGSYRASDYQRIRSWILTAARNAISLASRMRRTTPNSILIRTHAQLRQIRQCCRACLQHNSLQLKKGQEFECLIQNLEKASESERNQRLQLDEEGNIVV